MMLERQREEIAKRRAGKVQNDVDFRLLVVSSARA